MVKMVPDKCAIGPVRLGSYLAGIWIVSLGIVLCKKCGLGISPISCVPLVLTEALPLSFGTLTMLFHFVNTALQMVVRRRFDCLDLWLQVPLAFVFGWVIDFLNAALPVAGTTLALAVILLAGSIVFTAAGMALMLGSNLVQNPPDGTVKCLADVFDRQTGQVKVAYDIAMVVLACVLGLACCGRMVGIGVATLASALSVGRLMGWMQSTGHRLVEAWH